MPRPTTDQVLSDLGARLADLRRAGGETQADLAARLGVSLRYLQHLEYGEHNVSVDTLVRMANAHGVTLSELFAPPKVRAPRRRGRPPGSGKKTRPRG